METLTLTVVAISLSATVALIATRLYKIVTSTSFRVTNRQTGRTITVSSPEDFKKLLDLVG